MMASDGQEIIIQAAPFCYGPASIGIAIANEIRKQDRTGSTRLIAMGEQTSYDLFSTSGLFDQCEQIDCDCPDSWSTPVIRKLKGASKIVSVVDPDFSKAINTVGRRAIYVDPLYWMWDKNPISVLSCEKYFALNFPGVAERISRIHEGEPEERRPTIVDAVRDNVTLEALKTETTDDSLLITYGGMQSPLGSNIRLALVMTRIIAEVALEGELYGNVFIRGGGHPIRMITKHLAINNERIVVDPFPSHPSEFLSLLANCQSLVTVPG
ncbi:MAG: hypothetical protein EAX95_12435, partial [Candidatus Thorarchaeota archaeon]|nr:hypothetical protein [Candidatus Thorarchaeota archaeon]